MIYKAGTVRISRIETDDETYRITTGDDIQSLAASIAAVGLINPPVLLPADHRPCIVVCGFRRIQACLRLGWDRTDVRFLPADTPVIQCALIAIADNCSRRNLNLIETSRAVNLLYAELRDAEGVAAMAGKAGLPVAAPVIQKIRPLSSLPQRFQQGLIDETLSLAMAERLQRLSKRDALEVLDLFCEIRAGLNIQREMLDNAEESALREGVWIADILQSNAMLELRDSQDLDRSRKTGEIRKRLKQRRYPNLSVAEERYAKLVGKLGLSRDMQLIPPAGFEGPDYSLALKFSSLDQLRQQKQAIERLLRGGHLARILGI